MKVGQELLNLVKSLTKGENYTIRKALSPIKTAMYDLFRGMEVYDAKVVRAAFPGYSDQNLSTTMHQLIDMIVEALWLGIRKHGMRDLVQRLGEAEIFAKKSLYQLAEIKVKDAIRLASGLEAGHELLIAIRLRHDIQELLHLKDEDPAATAALVQAATQVMQERNAIEDWFTRVTSLGNLPIDARKAEIAELERAIAGTPYPVMHRNRIRYHRCRHILAYKMGRLEACMEESSRIVALAEEAPLLMGDLQLRADYFTSLHFTIVFSLERGDHLAAEKNLDKLEEAAEKWANGLASDPALLGRHTHATLSLLLCKEDWEQVRIRARNVLTEMLAPGGKLSLRHRPAWLQMAMLCSFLTRDFKTVRKFAVGLRDSLTGLMVSESFISGIGLFYLAALYEERDEFLETAAQQTKKWYAENGCLGPFETRMLQFFLKVSNEGDPKRYAPLLNILKQDLALMFEEPMLWRKNKVFPVLDWLNSHINEVDIRTLAVPRKR